MAKSYKVSVFAGTKVVADMAQQVKNATIEASIQLKTIKGGATSATPTILAPGPPGANRKMEDVIGWFVNGTAANPPVATGTPWEAKAENLNVNWWDGTTWSLSSSVALPKGQGLLTLFDPAKVGGYAKDAQVRDNDGITYVSLKDANTSNLSNPTNWKRSGTSISEWTAKIYDDRSQVFKDGTVFELNEGVSASASDVPGISNKWTVKTVDARIVNYNTYRGQKVSTKKYNISALYPTSGLLGTNKYDLATALNVLQADLTTSEKEGFNFEISFLNTSSLIEEYVYMGGGFSAPSRWVKSVLIDKNLGFLYGMQSNNINAANTESITTSFSVNSGDRVCFVPVDNNLTKSTIRVSDNGTMVVQKTNVDTTKIQFIDIITTGLFNVLSNANDHLSGLTRFLLYKVDPASMVEINNGRFSSIESSVSSNNNTFSKGLTNNRLFNDAIREFCIVGGDNTKVYRVEMIRNRTSDNRWSITLYQDNVVVSRFNTTTGSPEGEKILTGDAVDGSGIKFYAVINWDSLANNTTYSLATGYNVIFNELAFNYRFNPVINSVYGGSNINPLYQVIDPKLFTEKISNISWSGFIDLSKVEEIIYNLQRVNGNVIMYFYINDRSYYTANLLAADYIMGQVSTNRAIGKITVPKKFKWMSFRSADLNNDSVILLKNPSKNAYDYKKVDSIISKSVCISDAFFPASAEPNLLYNNQTGIVYANYICGTEYGHDPNGNFGIVRFPLTQPFRGIYKYFKFNSSEDLIDGYPVNFRDVMSYFYNGAIRNVTFGQSQKSNDELVVHYFDQSLIGEFSNFNPSKWAVDNSIINYNSYIQKIIDAGCTPYGLTPSEEANPHFKYLWVSSSKPQYYNGYTYFTINATVDCPMICRTNDDFATIEVVKVFQIKASYESALVINGTDWYYVVRSGTANYYSNSVDAGNTWTELEIINNSTSSKPRGLFYDGKIVFLIPTASPTNFGAAQTNNKDGVSTSNRYSIRIIRGDKDKPINSWDEEVVLASKYGINYSDIISVGKDLYLAYSVDYTHLSELPTSGKSQVMFTRIGNLDNANVFGDI
jgi:hypothetical protein